MNFLGDNFDEQRRIFWRRLLRRVFLEDWLLKLTALAITLGLWLGITGLSAPTSKNYKNVTLNLNISNNFEMTKLPPKEVEISVTGDKRKIDALREPDLVVSADLTDLKPGDQIVQLTPENVNIELPSGVKLEEIQPNKILIKLERVEEKEVEVKAVTEGDIADGFEIYSQAVTPARVRVRGAESFVKPLDSLPTEKINIENRNADFTARQVGLNVVNPNITVLDGIVDVSFRIGEKRSERIMIVPVKTERETEKATVVLYGARSVLEKLRAEDLKIEISKSESGAAAQVVLPQDVQDKIEVRNVKLTK